MRVGVAGCGRMGLPMARALAGAGFDVRGFDIRPPAEFGAFAARMEPDPAAFAAAVAANIASHEDNVRAALAKVELGEGDAAFVYRTDALSSDDVLELELPSAARVGATYAALRISDEPLAGEFLEWLTGPVGLAVLAEAGFDLALPEGRPSRSADPDVHPDTDLLPPAP